MNDGRLRTGYGTVASRIGGSPPLLPCHENLSSALNRDVESRGSNTDAEEAGEGSSDQPSPPGSLFTDDPLLPKTLLLPVNQKLIKVYGDNMHNNDGSHLNISVADDK
eukprot:3051828-Ditylum_brightwellii.AAC.1